MQMMKGKLNVLAIQQVSFITLISLLAFAILVAFLITHVGILISPIIIGALFAGVVVGLIFMDFKLSVYAIFLYASFMFLFDRISPVSIPFGVFSDLLILLAFVSFLIASPKLKDVPMRKYLVHPISIGFLILQLYHLFQAFNPNAVSLTAFFFSIRNFSLPLLFVVFLGFFSSLKQMMAFIYVWLAVALLAAVYGLYQEFVGLQGFEWEAINKLDAQNYALIFVWGHLRKFSFLSDPPAFGIFMALSALASFMLALAPLTTRKKIFWTGSGFIMLLSMSYSGTRTAYACVVAGMVFYFLLAIRRRSTLYVALVSAITFGAIMFGPFHNGTILRLRSAFNPSDDPSMEVRDVKRIRLQSYVRSHPIGGGIFTTGLAGLRLSSGHELATGWDADSGYLQSALETGWIGLVLEMLFYFTIMVVGINNYYGLKDPNIIMINLAFLISFFAVTVAQYTQNCMPYKPLFILEIATYAAFIKIEEFKRNLL